MKTRVTLLLGWLIFIIGCGIAYSTMRQWNTLERGLERRVDDLASLEKINTQMKQREQAVSTYAAALDKTKSVTINQLIKQNTPSAKPELRTSKKQSTVRGWEVEQTELTYSSIPPKELHTLTHALGAATPPFKILKLEIAALPGETNTRATLLLERISQTP